MLQEFTGVLKKSRCSQKVSNKMYTRVYKAVRFFFRVKIIRQFITRPCSCYTSANQFPLKYRSTAFRPDLSLRLLSIEISRFLGKTLQIILRWTRAKEITKTNNRIVQNRCHLERISDFFLRLKQRLIHKVTLADLLRGSKIKGSLDPERP